MRMWFLIVAAVVMTACATAQTPAPDLPTVLATVPQDGSAQTNPQVTPDANQAETTPQNGTPAEVATMSPIEREIDVLPPPGTIVTVPATEETEPGAGDVPFFSITYEESGGLSSVSLQVEIHADGTVTRNGEPVSVPPEVIAGIEQQIDELQFFNIQGQFTVPGASSDVTRYMVRVELQDGSAKRLIAQDGVSPPELLRLFHALRQVGI